MRERILLGDIARTRPDHDAELDFPVGFFRTLRQHHIIVATLHAGECLVKDDRLLGNRVAGLGRMVPTTAVDQLGATFGRWMGIADSDLDTVFPNLKRFAERDLGFLA